MWDIAGEPDIRCDVRNPSEIDAALDETITSMGVPESTTITAGVGRGGMLVDESVDDWDRTMEINTRGPWLVLRALAKVMIASQTPGSLVATSSVSAHLVDRGMGLYCASKAALSAIVRVAAFEWAPHGIRVNAVGPGVTQTPMLGRAPIDSGWLASVKGRTPLGRLGQAGDIAQTILFLHEMEWVTGQIIDCDGGLSLYSPIDSFSDSVPPRES